MYERPGDHPAPSRRTAPNLDQATDHSLTADSRNYTVQEAAEVLGITVDAVRGRIRRGTLDSMKVNGVLYVLLDAASREHHSDKSAPDQDDSRQQSELVGELRDQVAWLRREVERKDTIIMTLTQRIPELEAPSEPRESPETVSEEEYDTVTPYVRRGPSGPTDEDPPPEPRESSALSSDAPGPIGSTLPEESTQRSWWRRLFG